jgi:hypothetical protein
MPVEFWAALAGAVVGGVASLVGSVLVNRREHVRLARMRLHDELVPALLAGIPQHGLSVTRTFSDNLAATRRTAVLAGRQARKRVAIVEAARDSWRTVIEDKGERNEYGELIASDELRSAIDELRVSVEALGKWVERKIL